MRSWLSATLFLVLAACSSTPPAGDPSGIEDPTDPNGTGQTPGGTDDAPPSGDSRCPAATDPCMNEDNHAECLAVASTCDGEIVQLESCPLQFACDGETSSPQGSYDPCGGKTCGESCSVCPPDDSECVETAVVKQCDEGGACVASVPACN